jgi:peptidoglycan/xylan/chitin deacetylase (PgdA/CDA1 family)
VKAPLFGVILLMLVLLVGQERLVKPLQAVSYAWTEEQEESLLPSRASHQAQEFKLPVLAYHAVCNRKVSANCVKTEQFRDQMLHLVQAGYKTVSFEDLFRWEMGIRPMPEKPVIVTLDDGYANNFTNAFPILRQLNLKATVFLVSDWVGKKGFLTWEQVRYMGQYGIEFGAHTMTHPNLTKVDEKQLQEEVSGCKREIEKQLGKPVLAFAYPYGKFNPAVEETVRANGYAFAVSGISGYAEPMVESHHLKRVVISGYTTMEQFRKELP